MLALHLQNVPKLKMRKGGFRTNQYGHMVHKLELNDRQLVILYNDGLTIKMLAQVYQVGIGTIAYRLHKIAKTQAQMDA